MPRGVCACVRVCVCVCVKLFASAVACACVYAFFRACVLSAVRVLLGKRRMRVVLMADRKQHCFSFRKDIHGGAWRHSLQMSVDTTDKRAHILASAHTSHTSG